MILNFNMMLLKKILKKVETNFFAVACTVSYNSIQITKNKLFPQTAKTYAAAQNSFEQVPLSQHVQYCFNNKKNVP